MDEVITSTECYTKEKTLIEKIGELEIEECLKERISERRAILEKRNDEYPETSNKYYRSTRRLERTIVRLAAMVADRDESIMEDRVLRTY